MALDFRKWGAEEMKRRPRRASTRWLLAAGFAALALLPVFTIAVPDDGHRILPNVMPFTMLLIAAGLRSPYMRDTILTDRGLEAYDEFERAALMTALRRAYLTIFLLVIALFIWLAIGVKAGWPTPTQPMQWFTIGYTLLITMLALPATFAEFAVPMPDPEDEML